jgi:hypothetical protein
VAKPWLFDAKLGQKQQFCYVRINSTVVKHAAVAPRGRSRVGGEVQARRPPLAAPPPIEVETILFQLRDMIVPKIGRVNASFAFRPRVHKKAPPRGTGRRRQSG